ncbi:malate dehydrogenase [Anabaena sp. FACHB-709]|uniref:Malate dehydrogenase n=3 Tax=Nostocaceae TaxID=1162 RepID=MDH_NOSS1|nr:MULTISPECIES: malate dehydrogenase [Nostocaceae]Q8YP78.2 RecName: Full=Malate dehydrogenase [Nostoc sp. PCC 7120 = FACHB-418]BAY69937.1 malate dehydrogenase [Trichormus variabilis NIES-23]HBW33379.1 malate dehydrogenase [Nostoc sp. UBA8866]MBD2173607.1 malate dehydrogenase [Anabaena cylindrica FACHB-318]MBD2265314.1 malate dehydrogenase [Anabaena sp. FACHB-709]MBD2275306.1 malate dehydrogenase [Nostoc sp. PCC 7120 = FACHB-418]
MFSSPDSPILHCLPRVAIIGAGRVGSTLAQRIAEKNLADVVLLDIVEGIPQGLALDLLEARGIELHNRQIIGTNNYADTSGSQIVVITAGFPRKPGMSRDDLLRTNAKIVIEAAKQAIAYSPYAIFIVVTNPLDVMTYLAWEATGLPRNRIMGMAGVLDSARFETFIALELGVLPADVKAMVLGSHGDLMVPLSRYATVNGIPITQLLDAVTIERLVERTRNGGAEIVELMQTGGAFFAPASATSLMVESILLNQSRLLPVSIYLQGEYDLKDVVIGVPCRLGLNGIESVIELNLSDSEREALHISAKSVQKNIERWRSLQNS